MLQCIIPFAVNRNAENNKHSPIPDKQVVLVKAHGIGWANVVTLKQADFNAIWCQ